ncbi:hypothetical protein BJ741DRAFT_588815 [Chytriomyces cf. hyalinus JEL632]|nr:hypothetical protein BJ741DRAFT_588815 [Chytriomyces cf. hyalinus JEL632]
MLKYPLNPLKIQSFSPPELRHNAHIKPAHPTMMMEPDQYHGICEYGIYQDSTSSSTPRADSKRKSDDESDHLPKEKKRAGRKPATNEAPTKRIAQLRANTKAFRERKEKYVKDLEAAVAAFREGGADEETKLLRKRVSELEQENEKLRSQAQFTFGLGLDLAAATPIDTLQQPILSNWALPGSNAPTAPLSFHTPLATTSPASSGIASISPQLFSIDSLFLPAEHMITLQYDTFADTHRDLNLDLLLQGTGQGADNSLFPYGDPTGLLAILNQPLPIPPTAMEIIEPHFAGLKKALMRVALLFDKQTLIETLVMQFVRFTEFGTNEVNPYNCRVTLARLKANYKRVLLAAEPDPKQCNHVRDTVEAFKNVYIPDFSRFEHEFGGSDELFDHVAVSFKRIKSFAADGMHANVDELFALYTTVVETQRATVTQQLAMRSLETKLQTACQNSPRDLHVYMNVIEALRDTFEL